MLGGVSKFVRERVPAIANLRATLLEQRDAFRRMEATTNQNSADLQRIENLIRERQAPAPAAVGSGPPESSDATVRMVKQLMQSAAINHLPFLPYEIDFDGDTITVQSWASAPNGLHGPVRFFANGQPLENVQYPIDDAAISDRMDEVAGAASVRASGGVEASKERPFVRLDQASIGIYNEHNWRSAIHVMHPGFEKFPFPPDANKFRTIGDTHETRFKMGGATIFKNVEAYLGDLGHTWSDFPNILDWGCGAGRVTRYLIGESGQSVTGADIDSDNVGWCRDNLTGGRFETIPLMPKTTFKDGEFDLAIGISVFTHLTEPVQFAWLDELRRIIRPGGYALMSVQGLTQFAYNRFPPDLYLRVQSEGFIDHAVDPVLVDHVEDKEYYRTTLHSRPYIVDRWSEYFEVVEIADAIAALQDFIVLRRR